MLMPVVTRHEIFDYFIGLKFTFNLVLIKFFNLTVCLDGTLPGYHWHRGYGSGANSWLIQLEVCLSSPN